MHKMPVINEVNVPLTLFMAIVLIDLVCILALYQDVVSIAYRHGGNASSSLSDVLNIYKSVASYEISEKLSFFADKGRKYSDCCAYIFIVILIFNLHKDRTALRKWAHYLIPVGLGFVSCFLNSGRLQMLMLIAAAVFCWLFVGYWKTGWKQIRNGNKVLFLAVLLTVVLVLFYAIRTFVGRSSSASWDMLDYITMYAGGSIQLLNLYLQDPGVSNGVPGIETFYTLIANLYNYGVIDINSLPTMHLEYRYNGSINIGNVYTAYRRWIADFGITGAVFLQIFISIVFHWAYYKSKWNPHVDTSFLFMLLVYLTPTLMMQSIDSVFYRTVFCFSFLFQVLILYALFRICVQRPLKEIDRAKRRTESVKRLRFDTIG